MSKSPLILGIILAIILIALLFPQLAGALFLNLANTQIVRAVSLPTDAPDRAGLLADADAHLARAKTLSNLPRAPLAEARIALARNDAEHAHEIFNTFGAALQNDSIAQFTWGDAAWRANQPELALAHWRAGNALEYFRQQMYRAQSHHEWKQAVDSARVAMGVNPASADAYYVMGDALSRQSLNDPEAIPNLDRARALTQDKELIAAILSRKGEILSAQNKLRDAIDVFNEARRIAPIDARPRTGYAIASIQLDPSTVDQTVVLLRQVVVDSPWYVAAYGVLSFIAESRGQVSDAQSWLETGLQKNPNHPTLLFALGQFYARQHRIADAQRTLILAMSNETHADLLQTIADTLAELPVQ